METLQSQHEHESAGSTCKQTSLARSLIWFLQVKMLHGRLHNKSWECIPRLEPRFLQKHTFGHHHKTCQNLGYSFLACTHKTQIRNNDENVLFLVNLHKPDGTQSHYWTNTEIKKHSPGITITLWIHICNMTNSDTLHLHTVSVTLSCSWGKSFLKCTHSSCPDQSFTEWRGR